MTEIYKTARQVLVWLGQNSEFTLENTELPENPAANTDINGQSLSSWVFEKSVFARQWFFRLWTLQEVVLARRIHVLVGENCQLWESLVEQADTIDCPANTITPMMQMNELTRHLNWLIVGTVRRCRDLMAQAGLVDLQTWLPMIVTTQKCRNPRDKIYGLIGLDYASPAQQIHRDHPLAHHNEPVYKDHGDSQDAPSVEGSLSSRKRRPDVSFRISELPVDFVDYRKSVDTVFRDFARLMVESRRSLKFLTLYEHDTTLWFPQFFSSSNNTFPGLILCFPNRGQYEASVGRIHIPSPPTDDRGLDVKGRTVAEVAIDIVEMPNAVKEFFHNPAETLNLAGLCCRCWIHVKHMYGKSAGDRWDVTFIKDMIDTIFGHQRDFDDTAPISLDGISAADVYTIIYSMLMSVDGLGSLEDLGVALGERHKHVLRLEISKKALHFHGRRLVVLSTGQLALVQKGVQEGDQVAILHGLDVPCVMRKAEHGDTWQWLGDAFILGLMRGEGVSWAEEDTDTFTLL